MKTGGFTATVLALIVLVSGPAHAATEGVPSVYSFSPNVGAPGTVVTVSGNEFAGTTAVRFNGRSAVFIVNSNTSISATVPSGATTGLLTVTNPSGTATGATFYLPPVITSFSPAGGPPETNVTLQGYNFSVASGVQFGGIDAAWFSVDTDSRIRAAVPYGAVSGPIVVTYSGGSSSSSGSFTVGDAPSILSFTPVGGPVGTTVTISGASFTLATEVRFNGQLASHSIVNDNEITTVVPTGATTGPLSVTSVTGTGTSIQTFFVGTGPVVNGFTPVSGQVGTEVQVFGAGFLAVTDVQFNGVGSPQFSASSDTELVATVPSGAASGPIAVVNPSGAAVSAGIFAVGPTIHSFWPSSVSGRGAEGSSVLIAGESFTDVTAVQFNGVAAFFAVNSDQQITATVPAGATTGPISVTNQAATTVSTQGFEIVYFGLPPRTGYANWLTSAYTNVPVTTAAESQQDHAVASDSLGGVFVTWADSRAGGWDIYAQRITAYGEVAPGWPVNGMLVCGAANDQQRPKVVADGAGGAIIAWEDNRSGDWNLYAQRLKGDGSVALGWTASGVKICGAANQQTNVAVTSDGSSGALIAWQDYRAYNWDIYAQHLLSSGQIAPGWFADGVAMCTEGSQQDAPSIAGDAAGGAYVVWHDTRWYEHTYLQHVTRDGVTPSPWPQDGLRLGDNSGNQYAPVVAEDGSGGVFAGWSEDNCYRRPRVLRVSVDTSIPSGWNTGGVFLENSCSYTYDVGLSLLSDGSGGVFAAWSDGRCTGAGVYLSRVGGTGTIASGWSSEGLAVTPCVTNDQSGPVLASDGLGGVFIAWQDSRNGVWDVYAQRYSANGSAYTGWTTNGAPVCLATGSQSSPQIVPGWGTGALICWRDERNGTAPDLYAQRLDWSGRLGDPQPTLASVSDLPNDQGGHVRLTWNASSLDVLAMLDVSAYGVWRRVDATAAKAAIAKGAPRFENGPSEAEARPGTFRVTRLDGTTSYWEGVATVLARGQSMYSYVAETFADSCAASNPATTFMVDAHASFGPYFWDSNEQAGYSVDNIPPALPTGLYATHEANSTRLGWALGTENDLARWRVHRADSADFTPAASNLVATVTDTFYVDATTQHHFYKVAAVDVHGNVSAYGTVAPEAFTGVEVVAIPQKLWFGPVAPNPVFSGALLRLGLPRDGRVSLVLFDASGRRLRELAGGVMPAGEHLLRWDGLDETGRRVASGLYFVRLETPSGTCVRRFSVIR